MLIITLTVNNYMIHMDFLLISHLVNSLPSPPFFGISGVGLTVLMTMLK